MPLGGTKLLYFYFDVLDATLLPVYYYLGFVWADVASDSKSVPLTLTSLSQSDLKAMNSSKKLSKRKKTIRTLANKVYLWHHSY